MPTRPKGRRESITAAAADLFAQRGYAAVGVDDIGAAVGVTGPAVYRHFAGKREILAAVLSDAAVALGATVDAGGTDSPEVERLARAFVALALDRPALLATYIRERRQVDGPTDLALSQIERRVLGAWRTALTSVRPDLTSENLLTRQAALIGALTGAASRRSGVARPVVDEVLLRSSVAMVTAPIPPPLPAIEMPAWLSSPGKRDDILKAALSLASARGYNGVGIDEIGEAVGISGPTVYHYYSSKAELLVDAYDRVGEWVVAGADEAVLGAPNPQAALWRLAGSFAGVASESVDLILVTSQEGFSLPDADRPRLSRRRQRVRDRWIETVMLLRPELPLEAARLLVRSVFPLVTRAVRSKPERRPDLVAEVAALAAAWCVGR